MIKVEQIDHFVLTVASIKRACKFYTKNFEMQVTELNAGQIALQFGSHKISLHQFGKENIYKARNVRPGSARICLVTKEPIFRVKLLLLRNKVGSISNIISETQNSKTVQSIYLRDPDGNLLEIANHKTND